MTHQGSTGVKRRHPAARIWHTVDLVVSLVLVVGLVIVDLFVGFLLWLGLGLSGCSIGAECDSNHSVVAAVLIAAVLVVMSLVVGLGGLKVAEAKNWVLVWAPLTGYLLVAAAWAVVASVDG